MSLKNLAKEVQLDYLGKTLNRSLEVKFKNKISKSKIYISKKTGTLYHSPNKSSDKVCLNGLKNLFKEMIQVDLNILPIINYEIGHYYSAIFLNSYLQKKKLLNFVIMHSEEISQGTFKTNNNLFNFSEHEKIINQTKK